MKPGNRVIAMISQKGGAGKTTVAMQIAAGLAARGRKVVIADLDPQESALRWSQSATAAAPFPAEVRSIGGDAAAIGAQVGALASGATYVILDCPPSIEHPHSLAALELADVALVPVVPSPPDLWSARAVERLILRHMRARPGLRAALVANRVQRTSLSASVLEVMREFTLPILRAGLSQRTAFAQSAVIGASVFELGRAAEAAQIEVVRVVDAVLNLIGRGK